MIHPTALIDPSAHLGHNVRIGAYAIVSAQVEIGDDSVLHPHVVLHPGVVLGKKNTVHSGAILGDLPQDLSFSPNIPSRVLIGDRTTIREHVTIHRSTRENGATQVGNDCILMAGSHLAHDVVLGDHVVLANLVLLAGHVAIGDRAFIGGASVVHQFCRIGRLAIIQGASGFSKDIPPFTMAAGRNSIVGLNTVGLRRAEFTASQRNEIKAAFNLIYRSGKNITQALDEAASQSWGAEATGFFDFIRQSKRGICPLLRANSSNINP